MATHVRLKPYDKAKGHILRRFNFQGKLFIVEKGWYTVDDSLAEELKQVHSIPDNENSPLAFDICTAAEAKKLDELEQKRKLSQGANASEPVDLTEGGDLTTKDIARARADARQAPAKKGAAARR